MKTKTMKVTQIFNPEYRGHAGGDSEERHLYRVKQVTDSIKPKINTKLTAEELHTFCKHPGWKVTVV